MTHGARDHRSTKCNTPDNFQGAVGGRVSHLFIHTWRVHHLERGGNGCTHQKNDSTISGFRSGGRNVQRQRNSRCFGVTLSRKISPPPPQFPSLSRATERSTETDVTAQSSHQYKHKRWRRKAAIGLLSSLFVFGVELRGRLGGVVSELFFFAIGIH